MPNLVSPMSQSEALALFKMYEDKGWAVKQQVNSIAIWLTPIVFGLLAFFVKEGCPVSGTATLAIATAVCLSFLLSVLVFASLKHADRDYTKADELMQLNGYFPQTTFEILTRPEPHCTRPCFRFNMTKIGGVHILFVYMSFILFIAAILVWSATSWVCGGTDRTIWVLNKTDMLLS